MYTYFVKSVDRVVDGDTIDIRPITKINIVMSFMYGITFSS